MFITHFNNKPSPGQKNPGKKHTTSTGYIPPKIQIENMIRAGERLDKIRDEMYDIPSGKENHDETMDPTRAPNYDMADATRDKREVDAKLRKQDSDRKEKIKVQNQEKKEAHEASIAEKAIRESKNDDDS